MNLKIIIWLFNRVSLGMQLSTKPIQVVKIPLETVIGAMNNFVRLETYFEADWSKNLTVRPTKFYKKHGLNFRIYERTLN